jgi:hypothetical protein
VARTDSYHEDEIDKSEKGDERDEYAAACRQEWKAGGTRDQKD